MRPFAPSAIANLTTRRRVTGASLAMLYVLASTVGPLIHLVDHLPDHTHGPPGIAHSHGDDRHSHPNRIARADPSRIALERFRDDETGNVDLEALAHALGLSTRPHTHADGTTHSHDHTADHHHHDGHSHPHPHHHDPLHHGSGALEHFALALLSPDAPLRLVEVPADPLPPPLPLISFTLPPRPERLEIQYSQGPPAVFGS